MIFDLFCGCFFCAFFALLWDERTVIKESFSIALALTVLLRLVYYSFCYYYYNLLLRAIVLIL